MPWVSRKPFGHLRCKSPGKAAFVGCPAQRLRAVAGLGVRNTWSEPGKPSSQYSKGCTEEAKLGAERNEVSAGLITLVFTHSQVLWIRPWVLLPLERGGN